MKKLRQPINADFDQMLRIFRCHGVVIPEMRPAPARSISGLISARHLAPPQGERRLGDQAFSTSPPASSQPLKPPRLRTLE
jgi:hypothetical protein